MNVEGLFEVCFETIGKKAVGTRPSPRSQQYGCFLEREKKIKVAFQFSEVSKKRGLDRMEIMKTWRKSYLNGL